MKKTYLFGMAVMGSLAFWACSNNEEAGNGFDENGAEQIISLAVANSNSTSTRSGRPLLSSEANQTIENVVVYVVDASSKEVKYTEEFNNWQSESVEYGTNDGRSTDFVLKTKLEDGNYQIFAVGYHSSSIYGDIKTILVSDGKFQENAVLPISQDGGAEEIFAGSTESFSVEKEKGFKKEVVLNRQVAGVYVYAKDIPYIADATQLRLVASGENNRLVLGQFANLNLDNNGTNNSITTAVVNGFSESTAFDKTLVTINLNEWFSSIEASDNLINTTYWQKPSKYNGKATFEKGSVFGGEFVIPFAKVDATQTLKLQLTTTSGEVKREWNVNLPSSETTTYTLYTWDTESRAFTEQQSVTEDKNVYNIVRNHLYGLGKRTSDDPGQGTDPDPKPGDDDDPVSLNNKHEIELVVNDNWEVIHDMELD